MLSRKERKRWGKKPIETRNHGFDSHVFKNGFSVISAALKHKEYSHTPPKKAELVEGRKKKDSIKPSSTNWGKSIRTLISEKSKLRDCRPFKPFQFPPEISNCQIPVGLVDNDVQGTNPPVCLYNSVLEFWNNSSQINMMKLDSICPSDGMVCFERSPVVPVEITHSSKRKWIDQESSSSLTLIKFDSFSKKKQKIVDSCRIGLECKSQRVQLKRARDSCVDIVKSEQGACIKGVLSKRQKMDFLDINVMTKIKEELSCVDIVELEQDANTRGVLSKRQKMDIIDITVTTKIKEELGCVDFVESEQDANIRGGLSKRQKRDFLDITAMPNGEDCIGYWKENTFTSLIIAYSEVITRLWKVFYASHGTWVGWIIAWLLRFCDHINRFPFVFSLLDAEDVAITGTFTTQSVKEADGMFDFRLKIKVFSSLLYDWCKLGKNMEIKNVLIKMREEGVEPDGVVYIILLNGFAFAGNKIDGPTPGLGMGRKRKPPDGEFLNRSDEK